MRFFEGETDTMDYSFLPKNIGIFYDQKRNVFPIWIRYIDIYSIVISYVIDK